MIVSMPIEVLGLGVFSALMFFACMCLSLYHERRVREVAGRTFTSLMDESLSEEEFEAGVTLLIDTFRDPYSQASFALLDDKESSYVVKLDRTETEAADIHPIA